MAERHINQGKADAQVLDNHTHQSFWIVSVQGEDAGQAVIDGIQALPELKRCEFVIEHYSRAIEQGQGLCHGKLMVRMIQVPCVHAGTFQKG